MGAERGGGGEEVVSFSSTGPEAFPRTQTFVKCPLMSFQCLLIFLSY